MSGGTDTKAGNHLGCPCCSSILLHTHLHHKALDPTAVFSNLRRIPHWGNLLHHPRPYLGKFALLHRDLLRAYLRLQPARSDLEPHDSGQMYRSAGRLRHHSRR